MKTFWPLMLLCLACLAARARGQALDDMVVSPGLWQTPAADFVQQHAAMGFYWLSDTHDRASSRSKSLTLCGHPVCEVDAAFKSGTLAVFTISIYNRGDAGDLGKDAFAALVQKARDQLSGLVKAQPAVQEREASDAVKAWAFAWNTPATRMLLEYSCTREVKSRGIPFRAEFLRLDMAPAEQPRAFMAAALAAASPRQEAFNGLSHVKKDPSGDVRLAGIPMVDQGEKGYCVVASAERVMRYYGVRVDEHELAELANSSATAGTSNAAMFDSLRKLSQRLRVRIRSIQSMDVRQLLDLMHEYNKRARHGQRADELPDPGQMLDVGKIYASMKPDILEEARTHNHAEVGRFQQIVRDHIDQGIPVLWSVMLGVLPEKGVHGFGGHMRLIIGYNQDKSEILYSDSWGPGHELKRMPADDAWTITTALNTIEPL